MPYNLGKLWVGMCGIVGGELSPSRACPGRFTLQSSRQLGSRGALTRNEPLRGGDEQGSGPALSTHQLSLWGAFVYVGDRRELVLDGVDGEGETR
jgi:hypothetical protein